MSARDPSAATSLASFPAAPSVDASPRSLLSPEPGAVPRDLAGWVAALRHVDIPVLADTADALAALRDNEDAADANLLGELISSDPLMTLKVLVHAAAHRSARMVTDTETVTAALVMMGITPFFREFAGLATVEQRLAGRPAALDGLHQVLARARRAANFALAFAVHRMDHHAAAMHQAALLHDFAEMLLWCQAPTLALRIQELQRVDPGLRSATVQHVVLHAQLPELQHALMLAWRLPELLVRIADDQAERQPRAGVPLGPHCVASVHLAVRLARHTRQGWHDAALPDDLRDIGRLLDLSPEATLEFLHAVDR